MHAAIGATTPPPLSFDFRGQPSVVDSSSLCSTTSYSSSVDIIPLLNCCYKCAKGVCVMCAACHARSGLKLVFMSQSSVECGFFAVIQATGTDAFTYKQVGQSIRRNPSKYVKAAQPILIALVSLDFHVSLKRNASEVLKRIPCVHVCRYDGN